MLGFAAASEHARRKCRIFRRIELSTEFGRHHSIWPLTAWPFVGEPELAAELCDRSFRLNPIAPAWY